MVTSDINKFLLANGRLEYLPLRQFAKNVSLSEFTSVIDHAVLVGSGVYSGNLGEQSPSDQTLLFNKRYIDQDDDAEISLHSAIFYLHKKPTGNTKADLISIGRAETNDLVLDDTPISREHAYIRIQSGHFYLTDLGGTNGTMLNEKQMTPHVEVELQPGDSIGFGRYQFSFMSPERFFKWVYKY